MALLQSADSPELNASERAALLKYRAEYSRVFPMVDHSAVVPAVEAPSTGVAKEGGLSEPLLSTPPSGPVVVASASTDSPSAMSEMIDALTQSQVKALKENLVNSLVDFDFTPFEEVKSKITDSLGVPRVISVADSGSSTSVESGGDVDKSVGVVRQAMGPGSAAPEALRPQLVRRPRGGDTIELKLTQMLKGLVEILDTIESIHGKQGALGDIRKMLNLLLNPDTAVRDPSTYDYMKKAAVPTVLLTATGFFALQYGLITYATVKAIPLLGQYVAAPYFFAAMSMLANAAQIYPSLRGACESAQSICTSPCTTENVLSLAAVPLAVAGAVPAAASAIKAYGELGISNAATGCATALCCIRSILVWNSIRTLPTNACNKLKGIAACCGVLGEERDYRRSVAAVCGTAVGAASGGYYALGQEENIPENLATLMRGFGASIAPSGDFAQVVAWTAFVASLPLNFTFIGNGVEDLVHSILKCQCRPITLFAIAIAASTGFPGIANVDTKDAHSVGQADMKASNGFISVVAMNYASLKGLFKKICNGENPTADIDQLGSLISALKKCIQHSASPDSNKELAALLDQVQGFVAEVKKELEPSGVVGAVSSGARTCTSWCNVNLCAPCAPAPQEMSPQPTGAPK
jgi:hypothetical protein